MTCVTIIENDLAFQVKVDLVLMGHIRIQVLSVDLQTELWTEYIEMPIRQAHVDFMHEFTKRQAKDIVKRYLRYKK